MNILSRYGFTFCWTQPYSDVDIEASACLHLPNEETTK